jgi:RNA polymerase sigma factor (sigma-70 family)
MNGLTDQQLLRDYAEHHSEAAFAELVHRHVDLVYSAAVRMVCDAHLAQDVAQGVFVALAQNAPQLTDRPVLSGWLHRTARNLAAKTVRSDICRRTHEREAAAMNQLLSTESEGVWEQVGPHLDAALGDLSEPDYDALMLRYFERKSAREMAQALGVSDEAAQKRVSRAVERLRESLARRGVAVGAAGLTLMISANAVQAAPAGLAAGLVTAATAATAAVATAGTIGATATVTMTAVQKVLVTIVAGGAIAAGVYQAHQISTLRTEVHSLKQGQAQVAALDWQVQALQQQRDSATNRLAALTAENLSLKHRPADLSVLRNKVGRVSQETEKLGQATVLSRVMASPEARKNMFDQTTAAMGEIYGGFAKSAKLTPEQKGKLKDLLAQHFMDNLAGQVTQAMRDKPPLEQIDQIFAAQTAALQQKVQDLLGPDLAAQYQEYNRNLISNLGTDQFKDKLTGTDEEKAAKTKQLAQAFQEAGSTALVEAGLPADYLVLMEFNGACIASDKGAERSYKLLDDVYQRVVSHAKTFLSPEEMKKFQEDWKSGIDNSKLNLTILRQMTAPISEQTGGRSGSL